MRKSPPPQFPSPLPSHLTRARRHVRSRQRPACPLSPVWALAALLAAGVYVAPASAAQTYETLPRPEPEAPAPAAPSQPQTVPATGTLPAGSIVAFVPSAGGFTGTDAALRSWLAARGWAICDGTQGTPDLRGRMLLGTTDARAVGQRLGSQEHDHRVRGESDAPVLRNRHTPTGHGPLKHLPDDQHRHRVDLATDRSPNLPPSTRVLFIMKLP